MAAAQSVDIERAVSEIGDISSLSDGAATLTKLTDMENRSDWPLPAREAAVYQFTHNLATLPRDAVAIEVMQYLRNYQARVLVRHEDHGTASVPLFNVRSAAAGVEHGWQRAESASNATMLIESNPAAMVSAYLESANHNQRSGFLDALGQADVANVQAVQSIALEQLESTPELTAVIGATVSITADSFAIHQFLVRAQGAGFSAVLEQLDKQLQTQKPQIFWHLRLNMHLPAMQRWLSQHGGHGLATILQAVILYWDCWQTRHWVQAPRLRLHKALTFRPSRPCRILPRVIQQQQDAHKWHST